MEICKTDLRDVFLIKPEIHTDFRGEYVMTYHEDLIKHLLGRLPDCKFVEHDISTSFRGVLRGIHYSPDCWKLNECLYGSIYYVVVNCDEKDPEFGKWQAFILSDRNRHQIFKHPRYGTGFLTLTDFAVFHYLQSEYYDPNAPNQKTFKWDDPRFNIFWPTLTERPILSQRDEEGRYPHEEKNCLTCLYYPGNSETAAPCSVHALGDVAKFHRPRSKEEEEYLKAVANSVNGVPPEKFVCGRWVASNEVGHYIGGLESLFKEGK